MLVEVQCDEFKSYGEPRKAIRFHYGLNAVIGDDNGSNSIGKSTFLMILDFVFGGEDYVKRCADVQENVGEHFINFTFEFDGVPHHFSRGNIDFKNVWRCDGHYKRLPDEKPMPVNEFRQFLCEGYGLTTKGLTWRGAVGRFIRVYKRDTLDEERPLHSSKDGKVDGVIKSYMLLFDKYAAVEEQIKRAAQAQDELDSFRKSTQKYSLVRSAKNAKDKKANEEQIAALEKQEQELAESSSEGLLDLDSVTARRVSDLTDKLVAYRRERARVQTQLNSLRRDMTEKKRGFKRTFTDLERFFPNEEFRTLEEIERFHQRIAKILEDEFTEAERSLASTYVLLGNEIAEIEDQIKEEKNVPNVSQAILREYAEITTRLNNLREANVNFDTLERLRADAESYAEARDAVTRSQLDSIELTVNQAMADISADILRDETHLPPILRLEKLNSYSFSTPNDGGTGAQYRGLVAFDLANMEVAPIPFVVHDSPVLKHIERPVFSRIMEIYASQAECDKQVFMAYDTLDAYGEKTRHLVEENTVLELSPNGNELFGWAWNKKAIDEEELDGSGSSDDDLPEGDRE